MVILHKIKDVKDQIRKWKEDGNSIGLVPTMGYLHEGHGSLMQKAAVENKKVVVSIFVNPVQFSPTEDLSSYPRDLHADAELCEKAGVDLIFHPNTEEMYTEDFCTFVDMNKVAKELCGKSRATHFRGVCTVVNKLFNIIKPDRAYFGQKDAQQLAVIKRMVEDLNIDVEIVGCPLIREIDGLAKSSRNTYLSSEERKAALVLSKAVFEAERLIKNGQKNVEELIAEMKSIIQMEPLAKIDYVEIVNSRSIEKIHEIQNSALVAIAVFIGKTRLIDNFIYEI